MEKQFMNVRDVMEILDVSESKAYQTIRNLNEQLAAKGYLTFSGKVSRAFFMEKCCYAGGENGGINADKL